MRYAVILHGIEGFSGVHWQKWLHDELEKVGYTVLMPSLPQADHPDRSEWFRYVKEIMTPLRLANTTLIAHSLGVLTALDVVEKLAQPLFALVTVSGFVSDYGAELNSYFIREKIISLPLVRNNCMNFRVIYGTQDPYVPKSKLEELAHGLGVNPTIMTNGKHLNQAAGYKTFPELLKIVTTIK